MIAGDIPTEEGRYSLWVGLFGPFIVIHDIGNIFIVSNAPNLIRDTHICIMVFLGIRAFIGLLLLVSYILISCSESQNRDDEIDGIIGCLVGFWAVIGIITIFAAWIYGSGATGINIRKMQNEMEIHLVNPTSLSLSNVFSAWGGFSGIYTHISWERLRPHMHRYNGELFHTGFYLGTISLYIWTLFWVFMLIITLCTTICEINQLGNKSLQNVSSKLIPLFAYIYLVLTPVYFIFYLMIHNQLGTDAQVWLGFGILSPFLGIHDIGNLIGIMSTPGISEDVYIPMMIVTGIRIFSGIVLLLCLILWGFYNWEEHQENIGGVFLISVVWLILLFLFAAVRTGNSVNRLHEALDTRIISSDGVGCTIFFGLVLFPLQIYTVIAMKRIYPYIDQYRDHGGDFFISGFWMGTVCLGLWIIVGIIFCCCLIKWLYNKIPDNQVDTANKDIESRYSDDSYSDFDTYSGTSSTISFS